MPLGLTAEEAEEVTSIIRSTVSARYTQLKQLKLIEQARNPDATKMERLTISRKSAGVWVVTAKGRSEALANRPIHHPRGDPTGGRHGGDEYSGRAWRSRKGLAEKALIVLQAINKHTPDSYMQHPPPKRPPKP